MRSCLRHASLRFLSVAALAAVLATVGTAASTGAGAAAAASQGRAAALVSEGTVVPGAPDCPMFPADNIWNTDISKLPVDPHSAAWLRRLDRKHREAPAGCAPRFP
jgi:hypothetical protein